MRCRWVGLGAGRPTNVDDDQQDIDEAGEYHQQQLEKAQAEGWEWWPPYYDSVLARQLAEREKLKSLTWALGQDI